MLRYFEIKKQRRATDKACIALGRNLNNSFFSCRALTLDQCFTKPGLSVVGLEKLPRILLRFGEIDFAIQRTGGRRLLSDPESLVVGVHGFIFNWAPGADGHDFDSSFVILSVVALRSSKGERCEGGEQKTAGDWRHSRICRRSPIDANENEMSDENYRGYSR